MTLPFEPISSENAGEVLKSIILDACSLYVRLTGATPTVLRGPRSMVWSLLSAESTPKNMREDFVAGKSLSTILGMQYIPDEDFSLEHTVGDDDLIAREEHIDDYAETNSGTV